MIQALIDGRAVQPGFKAHLGRGIGRYAQNLLRELVELMGPENMALLVQHNLPAPQTDSRLRRVPALYATPRLVPYVHPVVSHHLAIHPSLAGRSGRGRVTHFLTHLDAPSFLWPRSVVTVQDLIGQRMAHLYAGEGAGRNFRFERWLETRCLYQAKRIISISRCTKRDVVELYGIDPDRIRVVDLAADPSLHPVEDPREAREVLERLGLGEAGPYFLYVGGIDQRKDPTTLLEAMAVLMDKGVEALLVMAGGIKKDRQYPALQKTLDRLKLRDRVRLLGFVDDADLPALYSRAAAFVFPSLYEGFGLPPLEAMACGSPVIAARAASVPEVVDRAGILVEPGRPGELALAMEAVLVIPGLSEDLRARGFARCREFSWARAARETLEVYREVADEGR